MSGYISNLRKLIGHRKFIHPGARIIIENSRGEYLFIRRRENNKLGLPAGALEENETIEECIKREVKEETGLEILDMVVIGIKSNPKTETVLYSNGDKLQYFAIEFYSNSFTGKIRVLDKEEVGSAQFLDPANFTKLPKNEKSTLESLMHYKRFGKILVH